jgi:uncharacterized protein (TIGR02145 family)
MTVSLCLSGCSKKPERESVSEVLDTLAVTLDTLSTVYDTLPETTQNTSPVLVVTYDTLIDDRDGKRYRTVQIGNQTWMAENLNIALGNSWCYDDESDSCDKYGRLYDWNTARKACRAGWHLPTREEWHDLAKTIGGNCMPDDNLDEIGWRGVGKKLKAKHGWNDYKDESGGGTDDYGFSALPGGWRRSAYEFFSAGEYGIWWTATKHNDGYIYTQQLGYDSEKDAMYENHYNLKDDGFSVRCVQNTKEEKITAEERMKREKQRIKNLSGYFKDSRDGRTYRTVEIGGKRWMAEDLNYQSQNGTSRCYYGNNNYNSDKYGKRYDWTTAKTVCPTGWHLPSREEWDSLGRAVGGIYKHFSYNDISWYGAGTKLRAKNGWQENCKAVNGTDDYGFSALPCARLDTNNNLLSGWADQPGVHGTWWTATYSHCAPEITCYRGVRYYYNDVCIPDYAYYRSMEYYSNDLSEGTMSTRSVYSVRCVQD